MTNSNGDSRPPQHPPGLCSRCNSWINHAALVHEKGNGLVHPVRKKGMMVRFCGPVITEWSYYVCYQHTSSAGTHLNGIGITLPWPIDDSNRIVQVCNKLAAVTKVKDREGRPIVGAQLTVVLINFQILSMR